MLRDFSQSICLGSIKFLFDVWRKIIRRSDDCPCFDLGLHISVQVTPKMKVSDQDFYMRKNIYNLHCKGVQQVKCGEKKMWTRWV